MSKVHSFRPTALFAVLLLCLTASTVTFAAIGTPVVPPIKGTIQNIDYLHHAITVNGQTYAVASQAKFSGIAGFSVLHVGMPIAYILSSPAEASMPGSQPAAQSNTAPPVITHITWLPGS